MADTPPTTSTPALDASVANPNAGAPPAQPGSTPAARIGSLYVADLAPTVTESTLYEFFKTIGQNAIASIRVCRDSQSSKSLGYAYVNFHRCEDADRAIDVLNYEPIEGRPCRISWSRRDPSIRKSGVGNVFIKNLAKDIDHMGLYDTFSNFGEILSCKVATDPLTGESKGYGFVHFSTLEEAEKAISELNEKCLNGKQVYVGHFVPRHLRQNKGDQNNFTNIYLKHIRGSVSSTQFDELVTKATKDIGAITSPKLMTKIVIGENGEQVEESLRFGFVNFENHETAVRALERFQDNDKMQELVPELIQEGNTLYAAVAVPKSRRQLMYAQKRPQNLNLYVKNIAEPVTEDELRELFKPYGTITSLVIMQDADTKTNKGFGFVCFEKKEEAAQAMARLNGHRLQNKPLYVALAQPKEVRRQQLAQHYSRPMMAQHPVNMVGYGYYPPSNMQRFPGRSGYTQRGRVPYPPAHGGRGMPFQMRPQYPNVVTIPQMPVAHQSNDEVFLEFIEQVPEKDRIQHLGDLLYKKLIEEEKDEYTSKKIVGMILGSTQTMPTQQTVKHILNICRNEDARREAIQQAKSIMNKQ